MNVYNLLYYGKLDLINELTLVVFGFKLNITNSLYGNSLIGDLRLELTADDDRPICIIMLYLGTTLVTFPNTPVSEEQQQIWRRRKKKTGERLFILGQFYPI